MEIYLKLFEVLFPVFLIVGLGYHLGKKNPDFDTSFITTYAGNFGTPALVIVGSIFMCKWFGLFFFLSFYSLVLTLSAAILICVFFVQHNYKNAYAKNTINWDIVDGAILGSSNLDIPNWLNWFLADISFHSIHHLSERIPNYNLRACHKANIHLLYQSKFLKLSDFPNCFKYIIWDNKNEKLIPASKYLI
jgi:omega-6 fatty acid desaturase (delta-12 desaturase)